MFPYIDLRLIGLAGLALGLMIAKLWEPILYLDWYWYLIIALLALIKPVITFFKQV
jgi:small basic protein|tara:strand:+ start:1429 stop:1596 length:168 start_codon:yes stop_codon:yes gene_type:complete